MKFLLCFPTTIFYTSIFNFRFFMCESQMNICISTTIFIQTLTFSILTHIFFIILRPARPNSLLKTAVSFQILSVFFRLTAQFFLSYSLPLSCFLYFKPPAGSTGKRKAACGNGNPNLVGYDSPSVFF